MSSFTHAVVNCVVHGEVLVAPFLLALILLNLRLYVVKNDKRKVDTLLNNVKRLCAHTMIVYEKGDLRPMGLFVGWCVAGYISAGAGGGGGDDGSGPTVYLLTFQSRFGTLMSSPPSDLEPPQSSSTSDAAANDDCDMAPGSLLFWERAGSYHYLYYEERVVDCSRFKVRGAQRLVVDSVTQLFRERSSTHHGEGGGGTTVYVSGRPGTGKTTVAALVARELNASVCMDFCPTDPGDTLANVIQRVKPTAKRPLVILLDEADCMIMRAHTQAVQAHKHIPIQVYDKATLNKFLDYVDKFVPHVLLMLTSNRPKDFIDDLDPSYLRVNRVHGVYEIN
jgi:hypothetical protein